MPELLSVEDLNRVRTEAQRALCARLANSAVITVHMGECGVAAGARATVLAFSRELALRGLMARVAVADCIGACASEPLVDVQLPGEPKVTYAHIRPDRVPRLIDEHLVQGQPVVDWILSPR